MVICIFIGSTIYIASPGPIFFSQERVGKNGKKFKMYKFRSMYLDAEERKAELMKDNKLGDGKMFKIDFDSRVIGNKVMSDGSHKTGIGEFIRKTSLDEFPQFFNVLKGDMSIVGTRPPLISETNLYEYQHFARLAIKPGITGMWQVSGRSEITDFDEVVKLDKPLFATLLCLAEYVYCTSLTYNNMIMAAGHIKQTQWISVAEAIINIVLSLILVKWIGIIGVALGTLIAFMFNTVANIIYMKKYIFNMALSWIIKVYLANLVAGVLAMCLFGNIVNARITGFISFFVWAAIVFSGVCLVDIVINYFFFQNETKTVLHKIKEKFAR